MGKFESAELTDSLRSFEGGQNAGIDPALLQRNELANALNCTVRGTLVTHRPFYRQINLSVDTGLQTLVEDGLWQGGCFYAADSGINSLFGAISGRLFQFTISGTSATVSDQTIPGDPNPATRTQAWLWQAENFIIWNDGESIPVFFDGNSSRRAQPLAQTYGSIFAAAGSYAPPQVAPAVGSNVSIGFNGSVNIVADGTIVLIGGAQYRKIANALPLITFQNINDVPGRALTNGMLITSPGSPVGELPPGRMGCYGLGRNWICMPDGRRFVASDIVGTTTSGTAQYNYRDAVLKIKENTYLNGGGYFTVPSSGSEIQAMIFTATLDASLGQGPLQVFTEDTVFSCNAPVDRTIWQNLTNPILTQSLICNGAQGQNSTVISNGDTIFRSVDGIRSLILGRRDFQAWGNVPQSREVQPTVDADNPDLLQYGSASVFDNRLLMTAAPTQHDRGVYHPKLIAMNFDPISSLRGKAESVYDGIWDGLNILQLVKGKFAGVERQFAFCVNLTTNKIELWEILASAATETADNGTTPITWSFESCVLFKQKEPDNLIFRRLMNGEVLIDQLSGEVRFQAYYKSNQWPNWVAWHSWTVTTTTGDPGYRPRLGLGEPSATVFDNVNNQPLREGLDFQFKLVITGHCRFRGSRFRADTVPQPQYARPA